MDDLLQAPHEIVNWTHPIFRIVRAVFERGKGDRSIVHDHTDLVTWSATTGQDWTRATRKRRERQLLSENVGEGIGLLWNWTLVPKAATS